MFPINTEENNAHIHDLLVEAEKEHRSHNLIEALKQLKRKIEHEHTSKDKE